LIARGCALLKDKSRGRARPSRARPILAKIAANESPRARGSRSASCCSRSCGCVRRTSRRPAGECPALRACNVPPPGHGGSGRGRRDSAPCSYGQCVGVPSAALRCTPRIVGFGDHFIPESGTSSPSAVTNDGSATTSWRWARAQGTFPGPATRGWPGCAAVGSRSTRAPVRSVAGASRRPTRSR